MSEVDLYLRLRIHMFHKIFTLSFLFVLLLKCKAQRRKAKRYLACSDSLSSYLVRHDLKALLFRLYDLGVISHNFWLVKVCLMQAESIQSHSSIRSMNTFIRSNCFCSYN